MLFLIFFNYIFFINMQSGFFIDFFLKKFIDVIVRNVFIYSGLFFGEKYIIEVLTKTIFDIFICKLNVFFSYRLFNYARFFIILVTFIFYIFFILNTIIFYFF